jgi:GTPase SAR1 family protein
MKEMSTAPKYQDLHQTIIDMSERLEEPLRVAVVGVMKAGKSTLMNALLKEKILYTATLEATYTVTWFKYGHTPELEIVFYDDTKEKAPFSDLEKWTVRPEGVEKHRLDDVRYVIIYYPNEILKKMELIDTPGLESTHDKDSRNTQNFLGMKLEKEADKVTTEAASLAEAIIYAFSRSARGRDRDLLEEFQSGKEGSSPINAIGIFTKTDMFWDCGGAPDHDPLDIVEGACEGYRNQLRETLYTVLPVTAKCVESIFDIDASTISLFTSLARIDEADLIDWLVDAATFATDPSDETMPLSPKERTLLLQLFDRYGIYTIVKALNQGMSMETLPDYLYAHSGVKTAADMILQHFGNRAYLIKLEYIFKQLRHEIHTFMLANAQDTSVDRVCERMLRDIERLQDEEQSFQELEVLQAFYNEEFTLADDPNGELLRTQFLRIMGEDGSDCAARLGLERKSSISELKEEARRLTQTWNRIANSVITRPSLRQAAETVVRSCETMYYHLDMLSGFDE